MRSMRFRKETGALNTSKIGSVQYAKKSGRMELKERLYRDRMSLFCKGNQSYVKKRKR